MCIENKDMYGFMLLLKIFMKWHSLKLKYARSVAVHSLYLFLSVSLGERMFLLSKIEIPALFSAYVLSYSILLAPMGAITLPLYSWFYFFLILMTINHVLMKMHNVSDRERSLYRQSWNVTHFRIECARGKLCVKICVTLCLSGWIPISFMYHVTHENLNLLSRNCFILLLLQNVMYSNGILAGKFVVKCVHVAYVLPKHINIYMKFIFLLFFLFSSCFFFSSFAFVECVCHFSFRNFILFSPLFICCSYEI